MLKLTGDVPIAWFSTGVARSNPLVPKRKSQRIPMMFPELPAVLTMGRQGACKTFTEHILSI